MSGPDGSYMISVAPARARAVTAERTVAAFPVSVTDATEA